MQRLKAIGLRVARASRTLIVAAGIYQSGYTSGMIDYAEDPLGKDKEMATNMMKGHQATSVHTHDSEYYRAAERVGSRVVAAAKLYTKKMSEECEKEVQRLIKLKERREMEDAAFEKTLSKLTGKELEDKNKLHEDGKATKEEIEKKLELATNQNLKWSKAMKTMTGNWTYTVSDAQSVNAFVSDLCPRQIFIHQGLFHICHPTDDELALVLSHEVSHAILGHTKARTKLHSYVMTFALILMSLIDPTGFGSFIFDYCVLTLGQYLEIAYSRETEEEADALGIEIAALACYDTQKAANIFYKFDEIEGHKPVQWNSTHPSSDSRYHDALDRSRFANPSLVAECKTMWASMVGSLLGTHKRHSLTTKSTSTRSLSSKTSDMDVDTKK